MTALQIRPDRDHVADFIRSERDLALDAAASRAARVAPGLVIVTDPVAGPPAQGVTESGSGAAMLVVGCRGAGAFTAMTLGSVSRYAAAHAPCPVVVVRDLSRSPAARSASVSVIWTIAPGCSPSRSKRPACAGPRCWLSTPGPARGSKPPGPAPGWPS